MEKRYAPRKSRPIPEDRLYRRLFWMALAASILLFFWGIWSLPILSLNEGRRMVVVQEMLSSHNWLIPTINEEAYLTKPPLFYWVAAVLALVFRSSSEWVMRLPSALSALFITWFTFSQVKRRGGTWPALFAALILMSSYKFTLYARRAEIEMLLAACCTAALFSLQAYLEKPEGRLPLYLSYLLWGLAVLTKGPAALPFFLPPLLILWLIRRDRNILKGILSLRGWVLFALIALPWYIYGYWKLGEGEWMVFLQKDVLGKTYWPEEREPLWPFLLDVMVNFLPWLLLVFSKPRERARALWARHDTAFWGCWLLVPLVIVASCAVKHTKYLLPLFPAGASLLGMWSAAAFSDFRERFGPRAGRMAWGAIVVLVLGWSLYYSAVEPRLLSYRFSAIRPMIEKVRQIQGDAPLFTYEHKYERLIYYYGRPVHQLGERDVDERLQTGVPFLIIAEDRDWQELEGKGLCLLGEYRPFLQRNKAARLLGSFGFCAKDKDRRGGKDHQDGGGAGGPRNR